MSLRFKFTLNLAVLAGLALVAWPWRNSPLPLRIGIEGGYPPFDKTEADGRVSGVEIDLAKTDFDLVGALIWLGNGVNAAVNKSNDALRQRFNHAIAATIESKACKQMVSRYLDFDLKTRN